MSNSLAPGRARTEPKKLKLPKAFEPFFQPARFKVAYGGRGSGKSWAFAIMLVLIAAQRPVRILCTREFQTSINDSVHKLICDQIEALGLQDHFTIQKTSITSSAGAEFMFKGLRMHAGEIKSMEGLNYVWCEEAEKIPAESWEILTPTLRRDGSEVWVTFNPDNADNSTYQRFVINPPPRSIVRKVNYMDNPWFPRELREEMEHDKRTNPDLYENKWLGEPKRASDAQVFKGKWEVREFPEPATGTHLYYGADWGFSTDPAAVVRCFVLENTLYIDHEAYGTGVEISDLPAFIRSVPGADRWPVRGDNARPDLISHVQRSGLHNVIPCIKGKDSVEDGISWIRGLDRVVIHPRCKSVAQEFKLYSYKVEAASGLVLPILVDKHNHAIDALRYALEPLIRAKHTIRKLPIAGF